MQQQTSHCLCDTTASTTVTKCLLHSNTLLIYSRVHSNELRSVAAAVSAKLPDCCFLIASKAAQSEHVLALLGCLHCTCVWFASSSVTARVCRLSRRQLPTMLRSTLAQDFSQTQSNVSVLFNQQFDELPLLVTVGSSRMYADVTVPLAVEQYSGCTCCMHNASCYSAIICTTC
jgi:hypothetical protein